jgi:hypothetical protein
MSVSVRMVAHAYAKLFSKYIAIMKKKIYNQPVVETTQVKSTTIILAGSILNGGNTSTITTGSEEITND